MSSLRSSAHPARTIEMRRWRLAGGAELRALRTDLYEALHAHRPVDEVAERIALVATELASNALRHGLPPVVVRLMRGDGCFIIDVADRDVAGVPTLADADQAQDGGRGLQIARSLSLELCWYATERTKHVWASFPASPAA
jgi:serine/threonine-protein kinase RsbW